MKELNVFDEKMCKVWRWIERFASSKRSKIEQKRITDADRLDYEKRHIAKMNDRAVTTPEQVFKNIQGRL